MMPELKKTLALYLRRCGEKRDEAVELRGAAPSAPRRPVVQEEEERGMDG